MANKKEISTLVGIVIIVAVSVFLFAGAYAYQYVAVSNADSLLQASLQTQVHGAFNHK